MSSTDASDHDTSRHVAGSSWPHMHQPNESYYGSPVLTQDPVPTDPGNEQSNDSDHSQRVFTQFTTGSQRYTQNDAHLSQMALRDVEREIGYVDIRLVEMGFSLRPGLHPTIEADMSLVRYIHPKPRYLSSDFQHYNGWYPFNKVPVEIYRRALNNLSDTNKLLNKGISDFLSVNPLFNHTTNMQAKAAALEFVVPDEWETLPVPVKRLNSSGRAVVILRTIGELKEAHAIGQRATIWYVLEHKAVDDNFILHVNHLLRRKYLLLEYLSKLQMDSGLYLFLPLTACIWQ